MNLQPWFDSRRVAWLAILVSSPLAYVGSIRLENRLPNQNIVPPFTREQAIEAARKFADTLRIDTRGWRADVGIDQNDKSNDLASVLQHVRVPALDPVATPAPLAVLLRAPQPGGWLRATVSPLGHVVAFQMNDPPGKLPPVEEAAARDAARFFLSERLGPNSPFVLENEKVVARDRQGQRRDVTWNARVPGLPEARAEFYVRVFFDRAVAESCSIRFDPGYAGRFRPHHAWVVGIKIGAAIYVGILGIYALIRYIRRAAEKEVSHRRTLIIALVFVVLACALMFGDPGVLLAGQKGKPEGTAFFVVLAIFVPIGMSVAGMFLGIAYGAGEGALRESYPGKLTSLDALLSGKLFSANVAQSILAGGALAGWLSLLHSAALLAAGGVRPGVDLAVLSESVYPAPLLNLVLDVGSDALLLMSFGLLLPLALLRPRIRHRWLFAGLLPVFCILCASLVASSTSFQDFAASQVAFVAAALAPFFLSDLLAATACVFAWEFVGKLVQRSLVSEHWLSMALYVAAGGIVFLLAEVYFARYGRTWREWEVRPRYARLVAEHLAMQAEISAARQAQVRLLPDAPPRIAGLSIAGSCVPSREVSGDFYDFYPLDEHRLGVFLAEGGQRELGSAMTIALAKGYLLYTTRLEIGPVEVLRRLREALGATIHSEGAGVSMLYAVIDTRARTVRFARTGNSPRMVINGNQAAEELSAGQARDMVVRHGAANLAPNDAVVFYSDGFEAQIAREKRQAADRFLARTVSAIRSGSALDVHSAIMEAAVRRRNEHPPDDVTAVVIRLDRQAAQAMEVVA